MATKDGKIVDEINGLIASRDSIRTTMLDASVAGVTNTSKLADLATKLSDAKLPTTTYNVSKTDQAIIPAGKLTTGAQTIRAVSTSGISADNIKSGAVVKVGDAADDDRIITVTGTFTKEDNNPITADSVLSGKIGYVNGAKVTGTMPNGSYSASVSTTAGSASMSATGVPTSTAATDCYITRSTSAGSVTGTATIGTAGWIDKGSKSSSPTSVSVSGNETKLYLAINHYYTSANLPSSSDGNNGDVWMVTA